jgi:hypothetical protein
MYYVISFSNVPLKYNLQEEMVLAVPLADFLKRGDEPVVLSIV